MMIGGGLLLLAAALLLAGRNLWEGRQAAQAAEQVLQQMEPELPAEAAPLWAESRSSLQEEFFYVYGCLESPEAAELVVEYEPSGFLPEPQPSQTVRLTAADWIWGPDGTAYFLCALEPVRGGTAETVRVTAYDRGGQPMGTRCVTGMDYWVE